jgi:hypothetical protein
MFPLNYRQCQSVLSTPFTVLAPTTFVPADDSGSSNPITIWDKTETVERVVTSAGTTKTEFVTSTHQSKTVLSSGTLWAETVVVYWQSSDLTLFPSTYATLLAAAMGVTLSIDRSVAGSAAASSGLGTGAKAGIAIGAVLAIALLAGTVILLCWQVQ